MTEGATVTIPQGYRSIWCPNCNAVRPLLTDELKADDRNDHDALDLICGTCRLVIATLHYPAPEENRSAGALRMRAER